MIELFCLVKVTGSFAVSYQQLAVYDFCSVMVIRFVAMRIRILYLHRPSYGSGVRRIFVFSTYFGYLHLKCLYISRRFPIMQIRTHTTAFVPIKKSLTAGLWIRIQEGKFVD